jgi:hypothetical protein
MRSPEAARRADLPIEDLQRWQRRGLRDHTSDRSEIVVRQPSRILDPRGRALELECESAYRANTPWPFRIACVGHTNTSTESVIALAVTASVGAPYRGWALTKTSSVQLERGSTDPWIAKSSSTGEELGRLSAGSGRRLRPGLSTSTRKSLAAILLAVSSVPDLRADPELGLVTPGLVRVGSREWSPPPGREVIAARLHRLGGARLALAFLNLGAPLPEEDPELKAQFQMQHYDAPERWGVSLAMGSWVLLPVGDPAGALPRETTGLLVATMALDLGRRIEVLFTVGFGGGSLDDRALEQRLGPGQVDTLTHFSTEGSSYSGDVGSLHLMAGLRYAFADWAWRPYFSLSAGRLLEPFKFDSPDVPATCLDHLCPHRAGFRIAAPAGGWVVAPGLGLRHAFLHGEHLGLEVRAEAMAHLTFWGRPALIYEGEVTPNGLETYDRLRGIEGGDPTFALGFGLTLEGRVGF